VTSLLVSCDVQFSNLNKNKFTNIGLKIVEESVSMGGPRSG
jgi:hypothetical protein